MTGHVDPWLPANAPELAARFGTPLYVFDGPRLAASAEAFKAAWGDDVTVAYSMKSNPLMGIVGRLHRAGMWAEVASGFEYRAARRAGIPGGEIVFNGPYKTAAELRIALAEGATVVADGSEEIRVIAALAADAAPAARIGLRLSPPGREGIDRFGMTPRHAVAASRILRTAGLRLTGLHTHLGAYQLGPLPKSGPPIHGVTVEYPVPVARYRAAAENLMRLAERIDDIEWLDLGGGWPAAPGVADHVAAVREVISSDGPHLILEPGRALVRDAGWLLVRVVARRGRGAVVVDAGITQVPCVLWKRSPVHLVEPRPGESRSTSLFGPLCLQHDAIARDVDLPPLRVGDLIWIGQTGAYAMAQASPFIHLRPAAIMIENGRANLLRERESDDEALGVQAEPLLVGQDGRMMPA
jgi:diaminopimelate decarboxylase